MAVSSVTYNKPILPRTTDTSDLGSNRASVYSGKGLSFDGVNDVVTVSDPLMFQNHTYAGWYYRDSASNDDCLFDNRDANDDGVRALLTNGGNIFYQLNDTDVYTSFNESGKWMFLAFTYDGSTASIYYNGELFYSASVSETFSVTTNMKLGDSTYESRLWGGDMSNFKAFNTALTAEQVKELYENPEQAVPTGVSQTSLMAYFPMTEGNGSYLYNANQGALGTELISNGGFDETCQKWGTTDSSQVEISNGKAIWTNPASAGVFVEQPLDLEVGKFYRVSFDYNATVFGLINLGNTQEAVLAGSGRWTVDMYYGGGNSSLSFQYGWATNSSASIDNVSVKEVVPTYITGTINGATWVSGLPEPLPQTALMDWNSYERQSTEDNLDYYQGTLTIPTNNGTIVFKHVTDPLLSDNKYIFGLGTSTLGLSRAIRLRSTGKYGFVSFGSGNEDFDTSVSYTPGKPTIFALSWDETKYVNIYSDGLFAQSVYKSGLNNLSGSRTLRLYGSNFNANSNRGTIIYWAYYNRVLTATEINDINTGKVEPTDVDDLEYYFTHQNGYSYNGVTLTKTGGDFDRLLIPSGSTSGKDVFGNTISNPRASGAYNFDGNSWAEIQDNSSLDVTGHITLESWVKIKDGMVADGVLGRWANSLGYLLYLNASNDIRFYVNGLDIRYTSLTNGWHHIVGLYDGSAKKLYVDGVQVSSSSQSVGAAESTAPIEIGRYQQSTGNTIDGSIANPRIYNYALTAEQVADNFNEKASTFGGTKVASELDAYIERTASDGATVEAHSCLINYLTELDKK